MGSGSDRACARLVSTIAGLIYCHLRPSSRESNNWCLWLEQALIKAQIRRQDEQWKAHGARTDVARRCHLPRVRTSQIDADSLCDGVKD